MSDPDDRQLEEQFGDLLADLRALGDSIHRQPYRGMRWPPAGRPIRRRLWPIRAAVAAAAAAIVLTVLLPLAFQWLRDGHHPPTPPERLASCPAERKPFWDVPTDVGQSLLAGASLEIPSLTVRSAGASGRLKWKVPRISFPRPEERKRKHGT